MDNFDILCGTIRADHVADTPTAHVGHAAFHAPVAFHLFVFPDFIGDGDCQIGADSANIVEVEGLVLLIFHAFILAHAQKKNEKKMRLDETFF